MQNAIPCDTAERKQDLIKEFRTSEFRMLISIINFVSAHCYII
jgi:hypothetical protein